MTPLSNYLSVKEVAEKLGVQKQRVLYWIRTGHLKAEPKTNAYLISASDLRQFTRPRRGRPVGV